MLRYIALFIILTWTRLTLAQAVLEDMRFTTQADRVQLVFDMSRDTPLQHFALSSPPRLVIDVQQANHRKRPGMNVNAGAVMLVRTGQQVNNVLRIVVDLSEETQYQVFKQKQSGGGKSRIVVDVMHPQGTPLKPYAAHQEALSSPVRISPPPAPVTISPPPRQEALPQPKMSRSGRKMIVVIDPGHGGKDPGAISKINGLREKDVVLNISKRVQHYLNQSGLIHAVLTRDGDTFIPLRQRIAIARKHQADMFVSIHADSVEHEQPHGSSVYMLSTKGASSQLARYLANQENESDLKWGVDIARYDEDLQSMLLNLQQEGTLESSALLAQKTLNALTKVGSVHKKRVERANFVVLKAPDFPSILVETAFISNPKEARLLATPEYQEKIARGIAEGILNFRHEFMPQHILLQQ